MREVTVRQEGERVLVLERGRAVLDLPWQVADQIASALRAKARDAEEQARAEQVARDGAILLRAGARLGLTNDPKIREEIKKLAAWDSDLRRYMPGGIRSSELLGRPSVIVKKGVAR